MRDITALPSIGSEEDSGVTELKAQHSLIPFNDVITISPVANALNGQTRSLNYLFTDYEGVGGIASYRLLELFGYKA